jgi:sulfide:quinone oxidoreductase
VGGGTAGIGVAAMLRNEGMEDVTIVEPSDTHYYQPLWTLVGGGAKTAEQSARPMGEVVPKTGAAWIRRRVEAFVPERNEVRLEDGSTVRYDYLVVAAGMQIDWNDVPGLVEGLQREGSGVASIYDYAYSSKTWKEFNDIIMKNQGDSSKSKTMIFTMSPTAIKCAGAPQKIMWLLEDTLRGAGRRDGTDVQFWTPGAAMFGVPHYADKLEKIRRERGVRAVFRHDLVSLDVDGKVATFRDLDTNQSVRQSYDMIHVAPHMSAPDFLKGSPIADRDGWVDVDKETLQSTKYKNVFGLGDCTNTPNSKTAAAITSQAPVVVHNIQRMIDGKEDLDGKYNGYASCPLIIARKRVLLAEFGYGGKIMETFGRETGRFPYRLLGTEGAVQQRFFYWLKEQFFPFAYWKLWVRGWWYGTHGPFKPSIGTKDDDPKKK